MGLGRVKSDRRRSVLVDGLKSDLRRSSTKESLLNLGEDEGAWLDITGKEIFESVGIKEEVMKVVKEDLGMEEAVEVSFYLYSCLAWNLSSFVDHDSKQLPMSTCTEAEWLCLLRRKCT